MRSPIPFAVWGLRTDLPWSDDEPHMNGARLEAVSVHYGCRFIDGPGVIVTSYEGRVRVPLALGRAMALRFRETLARQHNVTLAQAGERLAREQYPVRDAVVRCGGVPIPALELDICLPEATVIVAADPRAHPVVLGMWRWRVDVPELDEASFE